MSLTVDLDTEAIDQLSIDLLRGVLETFARYGVDIWMDQGTLLGAVRSNEFLPWDDDIDLGIWKSDGRGGSPVWNELRANGFRLFFFPKIHTIRVEPTKAAVGWRSVDIHTYEVVGDQAIKYFQKPSRLGLRRLLNRVIQGIDLIGEAKHGPDLRFRNLADHVANMKPQQTRTTVSLDTDYSQRSWFGRSVANVLAMLLPDQVLAKVKHVLSQARLRICVEVVLLVTPLRFFQDLEEMSLLGLRVKTPAPVTEYLRFKYGDDWRTPRRDWIYYEHDGAIAP